MTVARVFYVVRDQEGCDAEYRTEKEAVNDMRNWWTIEYPECGPHRVLRVEVHEIQIDPSPEDTP